MVGSWPLTILGIAILRTSVANRVAVALALRLLAGMTVAALPLAVYLAIHRSLCRVDRRF